MMNKILINIIIASGLLFSTQAFSCSECEDEVNLGLGKVCVYNVNRCPPKQPRTDYCIVGTGQTPVNDKPQCTNCSSLLSGEAGKSDCFIRNPGEYTNYGRCQAGDCSSIR
jgi:hypothetical protein